MKVKELVEKLMNADQEKEIEFIVAEKNGYTINYSYFSDPWEFMGSVRVQIGQINNAVQSND